MRKNNYYVEVFLLFLLLLLLGVVWENGKKPDTTFSCDCNKKFSPALRESAAYNECLTKCYTRFIKANEKK